MKFIRGCRTSSVRRKAKTFEFGEHLPNGIWTSLSCRGRKRFRFKGECFHSNHDLTLLKREGVDFELRSNLHSASKCLLYEERPSNARHDKSIWRPITQAVNYWEDNETRYLNLLLNWYLASTNISLAWYYCLPFGLPSDSSSHATSSTKRTLNLQLKAFNKFIIKKNSNEVSFSYLTSLSLSLSFHFPCTD